MGEFSMGITEGKIDNKRIVFYYHAWLIFSFEDRVDQARGKDNPQGKCGDSDSHMRCHVGSQSQEASHEDKFFGLLSWSLCDGCLLGSHSASSGKLAFMTLGKDASQVPIYPWGHNGWHQHKDSWMNSDS
jgi:hypothetical protein